MDGDTSTNDTVLLLASGPVLIGATVGIAAGVWLGDAMAGVYSPFFQFPVTSYHQDWGVVATAFLVSVGAALAGAIGSVRRVVALPPAEAMRPEAPASFRPGVVERLGLGRLVPPAQRMMLRNIERRPVKAALAEVGIAFATAIVFTGWYMFDVMDVMKVIQFEEIQRSDVMVVFQNPRSASAGWALEHLDGVRRVEPFRMEPVRLRHANRTRRAAVIGHDLSGGVGEEIGEMIHAMLKRAQGIRGTAEEHEEAMRDALGDMAIYLLDYIGARELAYSGTNPLEIRDEDVESRFWCDDWYPLSLL